MSTKLVSHPSYDVVRVAPGVYFVVRDWLNCNHFVGLGPQLTLIDTGYKGTFDVTLHALRALGADPTRIVRIVNTHTHCDHVGGNKALHEMSGCEIVMHPVERARIERRDYIGTWWEFHDTWSDPFPVHGTLEEGDVVRFGGLRLRAMEAPGHSSGQLLFYASDEHVLFSADAVWHGDMGVINTIVEGEAATADALETVSRLTSLEIDVIFPGHGPIITNVTPVLRRIISKLERFLKNPLLVQEDHLRKMAAYVILTKGRVAVSDFFTYLSGTVWFPTLVDRYFGSSYEDVYRDTIADLLRKGMVRLNGEHYEGTGAR